MYREPSTAEELSHPVCKARRQVRADCRQRNTRRGLLLPHRGGDQLPEPVREGDELVLILALGGGLLLPRQLLVSPEHEDVPRNVIGVGKVGNELAVPRRDRAARHARPPRRGCWRRCPWLLPKDVPRGSAPNAVTLSQNGYGVSLSLSACLSLM